MVVFKQDNLVCSRHEVGGVGYHKIIIHLLDYLWVYFLIEQLNLSKVALNQLAEREESWTQYQKTIVPGRQYKYLITTYCATQRETKFLLRPLFD